MMVACVLDMFDEEEQKTLRGRMLGSKNIRRTRRKVENIWEQLGSYARKVYRMSKDSFHTLHDLLESKLEEEFHVKEQRKNGISNGEISTKL